MFFCFRRHNLCNACCGILVLQCPQYFRDVTWRVVVDIMQHTCIIYFEILHIAVESGRRIWCNENSINRLAELLMMIKSKLVSNSPFTRRKSCCTILNEICFELMSVPMYPQGGCDRKRVRQADKLCKQNNFVLGWCYRKLWRAGESCHLCKHPVEALVSRN